MAKFGLCERISRYPRLVAAFCGISVFFVGSLHLMSLSDSQNERARSGNDAVVETLREMLTQQIQVDQLALEHLALQVANHDSAHGLPSISPLLPSMLTNITWVQPSGASVQLFPAEGGSAQSQFEGVQRPPLKLVSQQDGSAPALVLAVPLSGQKPASQLVGKLDLAQLLERLSGTGVAVAIRDEQGRPIVGEQQLFSAANSAVLPLELEGQRWELVGNVSHNRPMERLSLLIWGLLSGLALVVGWASYQWTQLKREQQATLATMRYQTHHDLVTGLPSQSYFAQRLDQVLSELAREDKECALIVLELDNFVELSETLGNEVGKEVLRQVGQRLSECLRKSDIVSRLEGHQFVILLRDISDAIQADLMIEKIQGSLRDRFEVQGQTCAVSASVGIALFPIDGESGSLLLQRADLALREAAKQGAASQMFFNEELREESEHYQAMNGDILRGIEAREFELVYQPVIDLNQGVAHVLEAELRWHHPERGLLPSQTFIPAANRTGAIRLLGEWALRQACKDLRALQEDGLPLAISLPKYPSEFYVRSVAEQYRGIFRENGVAASQFIFSIDESNLVSASPPRKQAVDALAALGVRFAISNFGASFAALNYLDDYPVTYLNLAAQFAIQENESSASATLIEVVAKLAAHYKIDVVAGGADSEERLELLKACGYRFVKGRYFIEAAPLSKVAAYCDSLGES